MSLFKSCKVEMSQTSSAENSDVCDAPSIDTDTLCIFERKVVDFQKSILQVLDQVNSLDVRVSVVEESFAQCCPGVQVGPTKKKRRTKKRNSKPIRDVDLLGSDTDEEAQAAANARGRLVHYRKKKSKKRNLKPISKVIIDVKPWDDETDMQAMEAAVRKIVTNGLKWGASKLVPVAYGIYKLQICCMVEDGEVSIFWLQEQLEAIEAYVQSIDFAGVIKP